LLLLLLLLHVAAVPVSVWLNASLFGPGPLAGFGFSAVRSLLPYFWL